MFVNKWATLVAATALQLCAGVCYTFSLYSPALKAAFRLSQTRLEGLGSALLSGGLFALLAGLAYDAMYRRPKLGPRVSAAVGVLLHAAGYGTVWAAAKGLVPLPYWALLLAGLVASNGVVWLDTACVTTCIRNTPHEKGTVIGILKAFLGVSASVATAVYLGAFAPDGLAFLLAIALAPVVVGLAAIPLLNVVPHLEQQEVDGPDKPLTAGARFYACYGLIALLVLYQVGTAAGELASPWSDNAQRWLMWGVLGLLSLLLLLPAGTGGLISVPIAEARKEEAAEDGRALLGGEEEGGGHAPEGGGGRPLGPHQGSFRTRRASSSRGPVEPPVEPAPAGAPKPAAVKLDMPELTLPQAIGTLDFWLLFSALFTGQGAGFAFLGNLSQVVESLGGQPRQGALYVLLFTTFNSVGRAVCGLGTERLLHRYGIPRTLYLVFLAGGTGLLGLWSAAGSLAPWGLLSASVFGGFIFGCYWSLMPVLTSELFGLRHFASNQSIVHLAPTVGGLALSTGLAGSVYDWHAQRQGREAGAEGDNNCYGPECYRLAWLGVAALGLAQVGASGLLYTRTRHLYRRAAELAASYDRATHALHAAQAPGGS